MKSLRESLLDDELVEKTDNLIRDGILDFLVKNYKGSYKISEKPNKDDLYEVSCTNRVNIINKNIKSLTNGMFIWTTVGGYFSCYNNQLTSLNASNCESLKELLCGENQLTSLDINGCRALEYLSCSDNQLTVLDVSGLTKLHSLYCNNNNLTTLNVNGCTALQALNCADNGLLGIRPAIFDNIKNLRYDIRYQYRWDDYEKRYVVHKDTERGYWYAHEPEGGCHSPNPCN